MENLRNQINETGEQVRKFKEMEESGGSEGVVSELLGTVGVNKIIGAALKDREEAMKILNEYRKSGILKENLSTNLKILAEMIDANSEPMERGPAKDLMAMNFGLEAGSVETEVFKKILDHVVTRNKPGSSGASYKPSYNAASAGSQEETGGYEGWV